MARKSVKPIVAMHPQALPQQRLYRVAKHPLAPPGWRAGVGRSATDVPALPERMPRSARYLAQVEWSWSPLHGRIDAYHLSLNAARSRWVLWLSYFDENCWRFVDTHIAASAPRAGVQGSDAAILLLEAYWRGEAEGESSLDAFHWVNQEGVLSAGDLKQIAQRVWQPCVACKPTDTPDHWAIFQPRIDASLVRIGAVLPHTEDPAGEAPT